MALGSPWHLEKFRTKNGKKRDFPELGALLGKISVRPKFSPKNCAPFLHFALWPTGPQWREIAKYGFSGPFWPRAALGTCRNSGPGSKTENHNFPELGALLGKKYVCPKIFSPKLRNFFTFCVFAGWTPRGGKPQNTGFICPFGLGQPLGA